MKLDKLVKITDLCEIWKNESSYFTPWFAKEINLSILVRHSVWAASTRKSTKHH